MDYPEPPPTAEGIKIWRKSLKNEPGKIIHHPGSLGDLQPDGLTYGRLNYKDASTTDLMNWEPNSDMLAQMRDKQESIYASTKAEPLGRSMDRGHVLPAHMHEEKFAFGKPGDRVNGGSKEALFPIVRFSFHPPETHPRMRSASAALFRSSVSPWVVFVVLRSRRRTMRRARRTIST